MRRGLFLADYINIYNIEFSNFNYMYETIKVFLDIIKKWVREREYKR